MIDRELPIFFFFFLGGGGGQSFKPQSKFELLFFLLHHPSSQNFGTEKEETEAAGELGIARRLERMTGSSTGHWWLVRAVCLTEKATLNLDSQQRPRGDYHPIFK